MNKDEFTKVTQAMILLFDKVEESEIEKAIEKKYISCAKYVMLFVNSFKF